VKKMILRIEGLDALVKKFEQMPEMAQKRLRLALKISVRDVREYALEHHRFTTRGGDTERGIVATVENMRGIVAVTTAVGRYQHEGTGVYGPKGQPIVRKPKGVVNGGSDVLRWPVGGGTEFAFAKRVVIKGIKPDPFLYKALEAKSPEIISRFEATIRKIIEA
jgi:hypothetical protein